MTYKHSYQFPQTSRVVKPVGSTVQGTVVGVAVGAVEVQFKYHSSTAQVLSRCCTF